MASRKVLLITAAAMALAVGALLPATAFPNSRMVGDVDGWNLGVDYDQWARANNDIPAGDTIEFVYTQGDHTVVRVDEESYDLCAPVIVLGSWSSGHDIVQLPEPGKYFFICDTDDHCDRGMKLAITVSVPSDE